jgi:LuxR family maltose regulon positive regulatory protein
MCGDLEAASQALDEARTLRQAAGDSQTALFVNCSQAYLQFVQGKLRSAEAAFKKVLHLSEIGVGRGGRTLPIKGYAHTRLSAIYREWNDVESAVQHAVSGLEISKQWGQADVLVYGFIEHAKTLQAQGRKQEALSAFEEAREVAVSVSPWFGSLVEAWEAHLHLLQGNLQPARRWAQRRGLHYNDAFEFSSESEYRILARLMIEQGSLERENISQSLKLLERLLEMNESAGAINSLLEILLLRARGLAAIGDETGARETLEQALLLAQPERYMRTFIDEGDVIGGLLLKIKANGISQAYLNELISAQELGSSSFVSRAQQRLDDTGVYELLLVEPLSERELQVLRLMDSELSSPEIADELIIAVSTVRSHIKNIYSKLGVHSRYEAVEKARQMNLI